MWKYPGVKGTDSAIHFEVNLKKKKDRSQDRSIINRYSKVDQ